MFVRAPNAVIPHAMPSSGSSAVTVDWSRTMPWRAPGTAPVHGSGCGILGGNKVPLPNGGQVDPAQQGKDGITLPKAAGVTPAVWKRGSVQEVGFGITANHGGGYSYRLCKAGGGTGGDAAVSEACFQGTALKFAGNETSWLQYNGYTFQYDTRVELPRVPVTRVTTNVGTHPAGSEWARVPIPGCRLCDQSVCGSPLMPNLTEKFKMPVDIYGPSQYAYGGLAWFEQQMCAQSCSGLNLTACPADMLQFDEPANGTAQRRRHFGISHFSQLSQLYLHHPHAPCKVLYEVPLRIGC